MKTMIIILMMACLAQAQDEKVLTSSEGVALRVQLLGKSENHVAFRRVSDGAVYVVATDTLSEHSRLIISLWRANAHLEKKQDTRQASQQPQRQSALKFRRLGAKKAFGPCRGGFCR